MIKKDVFQNLKGRRVYQFYLDEETGGITDITSRDDYVQVVRCKDCKHNRDGICGWHYGAGYRWVVDDDDDFCSVGERKEEWTK